jgi:hypothetical protein
MTTIQLPPLTDLQVNNALHKHQWEDFLFVDDDKVWRVIGFNSSFDLWNVISAGRGGVFDTATVSEKQLVFFLADRLARQAFAPVFYNVGAVDDIGRAIAVTIDTSKIMEQGYIVGESLDIGAFARRYGEWIQHDDSDAFAIEGVAEEMGLHAEDDECDDEFGGCEDEDDDDTETGYCKWCGVHGSCFCDDSDEPDVYFIRSESGELHHSDHNELNEWQPHEFTDQEEARAEIRDLFDIEPTNRLYHVVDAVGDVVDTLYRNVE